MKGIDVSHWQNNIDWKKVKASGIEFAIIKAGGSDSGFYKDSKFEANYAGAKAAGIAVGAYYFVGAGCVSTADGEADAKRFIDILKGKQFEMPVYIDIEITPTSKRAGATDAVIGFCKVMEAAGYYTGIYASDLSGFKDRLDLSKLSSYDKWVARYGSEPKYVLNYGMWQSSSTGKVDGISGNVDMDTAYKNYPVIIKNAGLNGFTKVVDPIPVDDEIDYKAKYEEALEAITAWAKKCGAIKAECDEAIEKLQNIKATIG